MPLSFILSRRHRWFLRLTTLVTLCAMLSSCLSPKLIEEEPKSIKTFVLTADEKNYKISRQWYSLLAKQCQENLTIPRNELPSDCKTARFFLNDSTRELRIAEPTFSRWVTGEPLPVLDNNYPPCSLLVTYGSFSGPPPFEGLAVISTKGLLAKDQRKIPRPADYALFPVAATGELFAIEAFMLLSFITLPILLPVALISEKKHRQRKEEEKKALPLAVAACWRAIDEEMENGGSTNPSKKFSGFDWNSKTENSYTLTTANEVFSEGNPLPIDSRVVLHQGKVNILSIPTSVDIVCGLHAENVIATQLNFLP